MGQLSDEKKMSKKSHDVGDVATSQKKKTLTIWHCFTNNNSHCYFHLIVSCHAAVKASPPRLRSELTDIKHKTLPDTPRITDCAVNQLNLIFYLI